MNSWKQFASGISSSIVANFESLAPSGVVTKLSFISGVNVLFGCVTAYQWQQQVLGEPAVKINESGAQSMENLSWVLADQQEIFLKGLTKSRGLFLSQTTFFFLEAWNREAMHLVLRERGNACIRTSCQVSVRNTKFWWLGRREWIQSGWK